MASSQQSLLSGLHTRLDRVEARLAHVRDSGAAHSDVEADLSRFADRHSAIRSLIDETATDTALSKADQDTSDLEDGLERWLQDIDRKFIDGPPRVDSVSM